MLYSIVRWTKLGYLFLYKITGDMVVESFHNGDREGIWRERGVDLDSGFVLCV